MSKTTTIRAAIIGLGSSSAGKGGAHSISYCHGWSYEATEGIELVACCSRTPKNVADFIEEFPSAKGFREYHTMLDETRPDLVSICAFAPDREEMVTAALEAGAKGVLIEKPFALSLEAAERMMRKAEECQARLFVNHQRRYGAPYEAALNSIDQLGELLSIDIVQPFGNILDFGSHLIDMALFFTGPKSNPAQLLSAVDWQGAQQWQDTNVETRSISSIYMDDGVRITYEAGDNQKIKTPLIRINGSLGFSELHLEPAADAPNVFRASLSHSTTIQSIDSTEHIHHSEDPALYMKRAVADIAKAMTTGSKTRIEASEALRGLKIMMAIYRSGKEQTTITFEDNIQKGS